MKRVLGEVPVAEDGSVFFEAPARMPIYFMLLDEKGRMVQLMRSWTMLQPGENASCIGCHEPPGRTPDFRASRTAGAKPRLFSCWIDLGVPFCGDYEEANLWNDADRARWKTCMEKRRRDCCR